MQMDAGANGEKRVGRVEEFESELKVRNASMVWSGMCEEGERQTFLLASLLHATPTTA